MPRPKSNNSNAKNPNTDTPPSHAVTRIMGGKASEGPEIGKANQYLPATYPTKRGNTREDR